MPKKEPSTLAECAVEPWPEPCLVRAIEVDDDVPAHDDVEDTLHRPVAVEIQVFERHQPSEMLGHFNEGFVFGCK